LKRNRLHGLDLSTKHVVIDSREPENLKGRQMAAFRLMRLLAVFFHLTISLQVPALNYQAPCNVVRVNLIATEYLYAQQENPGAVHIQME